MNFTETWGGACLYLPQGRKFSNSPETELALSSAEGVGLPWYKRGQQSLQRLLPVISTVGALLNCGVLFVLNQPNKVGVRPQTDVLPGLLGDIAATSIEITHEDEILKGMF